MEKYRSVATINLDTALEAIQTGIDVARNKHLRMSITIVDLSMNIVAFARDDGATPHSIETSRRKANTAASTGKVTGWMNETLAVALPLASGNNLTNIPGGTPIRFNKILVGGLGVAGGTVEQDKELSQAILEKIGADVE